MPYSGMTGVRAHATRTEVTGPRRTVLLVAVLLAGLLGAPAAPATGAEEPEWLTALNAARGDAGLTPVAARDDWTRPAEESSRYMLLNQLLTHDPVVGMPGYTEDAFWAANTGNLYAASWENTPTEAISAWLDSPGHAYWVLHPSLEEAGFGTAVDPLLAPYRYAATLPVVDGVDHTALWPWRFTYPGDGTQVGRAPRTLYVMGAHLPDGAYTATVTVDGSEVAVDAVTRRSARQVSVALDTRLPLGAEVVVEVRRDGEALETFAFTTSEQGSGAPLQPVDAGTVTGTVVDDAGAAVEGAAVEAGGASTTTDADGGYQLDGLAPGAHTVTAGAEGFHAASESFAILAGQTLEIDLTLRAVDATDDDPAGSDDRDDEVPTFPDVPAGHPHLVPITWMASEGITVGYPDGTFKPSSSVQRGAMSAFMYRMAGEPDGPFASPDFSDVAANHPHREAIAWMAQEGITVGYPDGTFRPGAAVERGAMSAFMHRMAN
jgi:uncharacterized protein YkwD